MLNGISGEVREISVGIRDLLQISGCFFTTERVGNLCFQIIVSKAEGKVNNRLGYFIRSGKCRISSNCIFRFCLKSAHAKEFVPFAAQHHS